MRGTDPYDSPLTVLYSSPDNHSLLRSRQRNAGLGALGLWGFDRVFFGLRILEIPKGQRLPTQLLSGSLCKYRAYIRTPCIWLASAGAPFRHDGILFVLLSCVLDGFLQENEAPTSGLKRKPSSF